MELQIAPNPEIRRLQRDTWNSRYKLLVGLSPKGRETILRTTDSGPVTRAIEVTAGDDRTWSYSVYWQISPQIVSQPSFLNFGNLLDEKEDHSRKLTITSKTKEKFKILSIRNQLPDASIECVYDESNEAVSHPLKIVASRHKVSTSRFLTGSIQIETTAKAQPNVAIGWTAVLNRPTETHAKLVPPGPASGPSP